MERPSIREAIRPRKSVMIAAGVALGGAVIGYDIGAVEGTMATSDWMQMFADGSMTAKIIRSTYLAGAVAGVGFSSASTHLIGRRTTLVLSSSFFVVSTLIQMLSTTPIVFLSGRAVAGLGAGILSATVPVYQAEIVPNSQRSILIVGFDLAISSAGLVGLGVSGASAGLESTKACIVPTSIVFVWTTLLAVGMLLLPETPYHYICKGKLQRAKHSLGRIWNLSYAHHTVTAAVRRMNARHDLELPTVAGVRSCMGYARSRMAKNLAVAVGIHLLKHTLGSGFLFYYGSQVFSELGVSTAVGRQALLLSFEILGLLTAVAVMKLVSHRTMLVLGAGGLFVVQLIVALLSAFLTEEDRDTGRIRSRNDTTSGAIAALSCVGIYIYSATWNPRSWAITSEIFPTIYRPSAMALTTAAHWLSCLGANLLVMHLVGVGKYNMHSVLGFVWAGMCLICMVAAYFLVYDFNTRPLESLNYGGELHPAKGKGTTAGMYTQEMTWKEIPYLASEAVV